MGFTGADAAAADAYIAEVSSAVKLYSDSACTEPFSGKLSETPNITAYYKTDGKTYEFTASYGAGGRVVASGFSAYSGS